MAVVIVPTTDKIGSSTNGNDFVPLENSRVNPVAFCQLYLKVMTSFLQGVKPKPRPSPKPPRPGQATYFWEGCYNDKRRRAIRYRLGNFHRRKDPVSACAAAALRRRFKVFAVENGGECYSGRSAHRTYNRYGPTNRCRRGRGGPWAMDVYKFGQRMSYVELCL